MNSRPSLPPWLQAAQSRSHSNTVLHVLAKRERQRDGARNASRHRSHPSQAHRLFANAFQNPDLVDRYSVATGHENRVGNRYLGVEPYDRTRVIVGGEGEQCDVGACGQGRYLNASWVREALGGKWWIATQAPLPNTAHAFLSLILQQITRPPEHLDPPPLTSKSSRIRTVVQLTQNIESGRQKAHGYFPADDISPEEGIDLPALKVSLVETKIIPEAHCVQSTVSVAPIFQAAHYEHEPIIFRHMMYTAWPDHGVPEPEDRASLLAFIRLVDQTNKDISNQHRNVDLDPDPPIMVNCSAGIGRTGSFIALSSLLRAYDLMSSHSRSRQLSTTPMTVSPLPTSLLRPLPDDIKDDLVAQEVDSLREQRPGMVQRDEQILLIYEVLATAFSEGEGEPD